MKGREREREKEREQNDLVERNIFRFTDIFFHFDDSQNLTCLRNYNAILSKDLSTLRKVKILQQF